MNAEFKYDDFLKEITMIIPSESGDWFKFYVTLGYIKAKRKDEFGIKVYSNINLKINDNGNCYNPEFINFEKEFYSDTMIAEAILSESNMMGSINKNTKKIEDLMKSAIFENMSINYEINFSKYYKTHVLHIFAKMIATVYHIIMEERK